MKSYQDILDEVKAEMNIGDAPKKADFTVYYAYKAGEVKRCSTKAEALAFSSNVEAHTLDYDIVSKQHRENMSKAYTKAERIMMARFMDSCPGITEDQAKKLAGTAVNIMNDTNGLSVDSGIWNIDVQFDIMDTLWSCFKNFPKAK